MTTVAQNSELPPPYTERVDTVQPVTNQPIVLQTVIIPLTLKRTPVYVNCPNCNERILTTVQHTNTQKTHMIAGFVCGLTLCCMLCCLSAIPYIIPTCKKTEHYCPNCKSYIGTYS
ncbi:Membrane-associated LPS-inducible TNF alpha factor protein [Danaus plexippus plexippus]|uniref:Membrane-associated LPS-inducible TNF alpha factor protein n=1 Tax=Danaus plexippus plexippus TaxID=278856 RepID=A0A212EZ36_DANPL|nr:Membrane-associated LPS-inducible TNF alpha factor protein [Danaus plexippus plexippus]